MEVCKNCKWLSGSRCRKIKEWVGMEDWCYSFKSKSDDSKKAKRKFIQENPELFRDEFHGGLFSEEEITNLSQSLRRN